MGPSRKSRTVATDRRFYPGRAFITCVKLAVLAVFVGLAVCASTAADTPRPQPAPVAPFHQAAPAASTCPTPAPTTAAGYAAMFRSLPTTVWGAADVSISVKVGGRVVWLYGDTLSNVTQWPPTDPSKFRMFHSTAITQDRGCLHVSQHGSWLLPDQVDLSNYTNPATATAIPAWFWIKSAAVDGGPDRFGVYRLLITADHVQQTGPGMWDFKVVGQQTALTWVMPNGDVLFQQWLYGHAPIPVQHIVQKDGGIYAPWTQTVSEIANGKILVSGLPHTTANFSYAPSVHPEITLASGKTLLTVCQNSSPLGSYAGYQPLWFEVTL